MIGFSKGVIYGVAFLVFLLALSQTSVASINKADKDAFYLSVTLNDPYNADLLVRTPIRIGAPFRVTVENGDVKTTISGTVGEPVEDKYPLTITVAEWASANSNISDTNHLRLELDKPTGYGPVSSFVYLRTVTLSKKLRP